MTQEQIRRKQHKIRQERLRRKQLQRLIGAAVACVVAGAVLGCTCGIKICSYGDDSNIAVSGCGPTTLAMAIVALTGNAVATPDEVADFAMDEGYYMSGTGTMWSLMTDGAASYELDSEQLGDVNEQKIKECLDAGELVICSMRAGDFTTGGHFILVYDYDTDGFLLNDPFCVYRSGKKWAFESLEGQIKVAWAVAAQDN